MVSQIDPTVPVFGNPTTASVRANFLIAKNEITALQNQVGIGAPVSVSAGGTGASTPAQAAINLNVLPLTGGTLTGPLLLNANPTNLLGAAPKQYVDAYFPVTIVNGGTGANNPTQARINLGAAPGNSPNFTGNPTAPTPPSNDNSASLATTAYVQNALAASFPISITQGGTGATSAVNALLNLGAAPLNSPFFTGIPLAPNPNLGSSNQQIATTQFVMASLDAFPGGASVTLSPTEPPNPRNGDLWFNTTNNELNMWDGTNWIPVGGSTGPQGPAGPPGQGLVISGTVATSADLPTTGVSPNAIYMALDTGIGYIWNGTTWTSLGVVLQGPQGPPGPGGGGGANTVISDTAPTPPTVGQLWWDSVGGQLYIYFQDADSTQWVIANNQPGPTGPAGATGPQGPQGLPGTPWPEAPTDGRLYGRDGATTSWNPVPTEAPNDGQGYLRVGVLPGTWEAGLPISGGTLTGPLTLDANATLALQAVPLQQLTSAITAATANYFPLNIAAPTLTTGAGSIGFNNVGGISVGSPSIFSAAGSTGQTTAQTLVVNTTLTVSGGSALGGAVTMDSGFNVPNVISATGSAVGINVPCTMTGTLAVGNSINAAGNFYGPAAGFSVAAGPDTNTAVLFLAADNIYPVGNIIPNTNDFYSCGNPGSNSWLQVSAFSFPNPSDMRLKENVSPAPTGALGRVNAIPVYTFSYKGGASAGKQHHGFDAKEVETHHPNAIVPYEGDETLAINLPDMIALLWQAIQELSAELAALRAAPAAGTA